MLFVVLLLAVGGVVEANDLSQVVGTANFTRFRLLHMRGGVPARPDAWVEVDELIAAGQWQRATRFAAAFRGPDARALRSVLARQQADGRTARAAFQTARAQGAAGHHALATATLEATAARRGSILEARMGFARAQALKAVERYRSGARGFTATARAARELGWSALEARALEECLTCLVVQEEHAEMLHALKRLLVLRAAGPDKRLAAAVEADLGCIYGTLSNHARALDHLHAAASAFSKGGHPHLQARALAGVGLVHLRRSEFTPALEVLERALSLCPATGRPEERAYIRSLLGSLYENMGDLRSAQGLYEQSLKKCPTGVVKGDLLGNLGNVHYRLGNDEDAHHYFAEAAALFEEVDDATGMATALFGRGQVHRAEGQASAALDDFRAALRLQRRDSAQAARTLGALADTQLILGRTADALVDVEGALERVRASTARSVQIELLDILARVQLAKRRPAVAIETTRRALDIMDELTVGLADEHVAGVRENRSWVFDTGLEAAMRVGRVDVCCEFIERSRAGGLLLACGVREHGPRLTPELVEAETLAAHRLAAANRAYQAARAARRIKRIGEASSQLEDAQRNYRAVQQRIQRATVQHSTTCKPIPCGFSEIRRVLGTGDVLVMYVFLAKRCHALVVQPESARLVDLGPTVDVRSAVRELGLGADGQNSDSPEVVRARLDALARLVLDPLQIPAKARRLFVSPDDALCYVPFPLLVGERDLDVSCVPSGSALGVLSEERLRGGQGVLAVGDPEYTLEAEGRSIQVFAAGRPLDPLPATRREVKSITSKRDVRLLGVHATAANLVEVAATRPRWEVIHLACHGLINTDTPSLSALALTPHGADDGFLTALEVHNMRLRADLVVLSGCNTGRGKQMKGEGLVGLMRAFLSAGAPRVLVSLWKVDDKATQALMTRFHQFWRKEGWSAARALRKAQQEVRSHAEWRHPRYWGAWAIWGLMD